MLTLKLLKSLEPHSIFATGICENSPAGAFITDDGGELRWVAVRGQIHDWAIYVGRVDQSEEDLRDVGDKIYTEQYITNLVPCDTEALKMYRY